MASASNNPAAASAFPGASLNLIDASCRLPLLTLFLGSATWLLISATFSLIASIKFHSPDFLASPDWLTYGRVKAVATHSLIYGFAIPAALGLTLWLIARLGRALLSAPVVITSGALLWNIGLFAGVASILTGNMTGFESLEFPLGCAVVLFLAYVLIGVPAILTLQRRAERRLYVSQWFLLAALFWFPWIYSTANLMLLAAPVRGMAQAVIAWWFSANLLLVWFGLIGLAVAFYLLPRITGRDLSSHHLALFVFWILILFGSWTGIPPTAPVPAWMPVLSSVAMVLMSLCLIALFLVIHFTLGGNYSLLWSDTSLRFVSFGLLAFFIAVAMGIAEVIAGISRPLNLSWFDTARYQLNSYGFMAMILFGGIYHILPKLANMDLPSSKLFRVHFWVSAVGILLAAIPLAVGGIIQTNKIANPEIAFVDVSKATLHFLRISTMGDTLILLGNLLLLLNVGLLVFRYYRTQFQTGFSAATLEVQPQGVKS